MDPSTPPPPPPICTAGFLFIYLFFSPCTCKVPAVIDLINDSVQNVEQCILLQTRPFARCFLPYFWSRLCAKWRLTESQLQAKFMRGFFCVYFLVQAQTDYFQRFRLRILLYHARTVNQQCFLIQTVHGSTWAKISRHTEVHTHSK